MKKILYVVLLTVLFVIGINEVNASSGALRKASIKTCNGVTYGQHGSDNHWHQAKSDADVSSGWVAIGNPIYSDPCSSSSNSSSNNIDSGSSSSTNSSNNNSSVSSSNNSSSNNNSSGFSSTESSSNDNSSISSSNSSSSGSSNVENNNNSNSSTNNNPNSNNTSNEEEIEIKNNDNTLKSIFIDGKEVKVEDNIDYTTTKETVTITATTNDENAKYEIKNNSNLEIGNNKILIEVTAEDGTTKNYIINVNRNKIVSSDTGIKIIINEKEVEFSNNKATVYVSSNENNLKINYIVSDENANVEMNKIEELKTGDNDLKVKVIAEDGTEKEYEITIHKYSKSEDTIYMILGLGMIGGIGYGIYYIFKKCISKSKNTILKK